MSLSERLVWSSIRLGARVFYGDTTQADWIYEKVRRPRTLWLVVVLVSGFSFAGYAAVKLLGPARGVLATAAAGSMVSSTAVTASLAGKLRDGSGDRMLLNAGVALASATMFLRVMVLTGARHFRH